MKRKRLKRDSQNKVPKKESVSTIPIEKLERCLLCKQILGTVLFYGGHQNYSTEEFVALTDERINMFNGMEEYSYDRDPPTYRITYFSVYDKNGHLCPFDTGLVENNTPLYFSGFLKTVDDDDPNPKNGVPCHDLGPIDEWWMAGFDGGNELAIAFTTNFANYYLMQPSLEYEPVFCRIREKINLVKLVVEFLFEHAYQNPRLEDLIEHIEYKGPYKNAADILVQNAQFICNQLVNIDEPASEDDHPIYTLPCIRSLVQMAGVSFHKLKNKKFKVMSERNSNIMTKAVTTKLVNDVFEHFFPDQIDAKEDNKGPKKKRCGVCESCQSPDCGECNHCLDMRKFGGSGKSKQACKSRKCVYMAIADAELSDNEDETDTKEVKKKNKILHVSKKVIHKVKWKEEAPTIYKRFKCYLSAEIGDFTVQIGDYVMLKLEDDQGGLCIARIIYMYDNFPQNNVFHGHILSRGTDSILGETADPRELFVVDDCDELLLGSVIRKAKVEYRKIPDNWFELGGELNLEEPLEDDGETFFFTKRLEKNRFVDLDFNPEEKIDGCDSCRRKALEKKLNTPTLVDNCVTWKNEEYKVGCGVFLDPDVYTFETDDEIKMNDKESEVDQVLYPEFYRKTSENIKGSNKETPQPFVIGIIEDIFESKNKEINIKVNIFFRPENTYGSIFSAYTTDLNCLYYSEIVITVPFENVAAKCYLAYGYNVEYIREWADKGPFRFYFTEAYDPRSSQVVNVPTRAKNIGLVGKGKVAGKVKAKGQQKLPELLPVWELPTEPLRCMDVFAGCGGLSEGLKQSQIIKSKWAIEKEVPAAKAFQQNNPNCKVFIDDCNNILKHVLNNRAKEKGFPEKGEVEMLVGGPPCQGFSGMNRFNSRNYSSFKNSLVVSYLSYCEYYRPKYFILENVRNFVSFKKSMVLKLTLRCLLAMGYQVTFGILQAGQYGIPQTRRRLILMAAAPGYVLPTYPEPLHVFSRKGTHLTFVVDGNSYNSEYVWRETAPYRTITVRDALSDLPDIGNVSVRADIPYDSDPETHFQRKMRVKGENDIARDHICKEMSALVEARMSQIPISPGADWRDLPNIKLTLNDDTVTSILIYQYRTKKQKPSDPPRGVCRCAVNGICDPADKKGNTLIPWCLPHTGDRHNHWAGLYGRLDWDGYFGTTITNPEPMGKQGRVLHPEQHRVVSVRECARSQGFPDEFRFFGNILDKYRQVGNAVPPPLGLAIGREIVKALNKSSKKP